MNRWYLLLCGIAGGGMLALSTDTLLSVAGVG